MASSAVRIGAQLLHLMGRFGDGIYAPPMTPDDLVELEQIKRLKYAYARCLDLKLWDEIAGLFTPDAIAAYSGGGYTFEGREAIVEFLHPVDGLRDVPLEPQDAPSRDRADRARIRRRACGRSTTP